MLRNQNEPADNTRAFLQGSLKHTRAAAIAALPVVCAAVLATTAMASSQCEDPCPTPDPPPPCGFVTSGGFVFNDAGKEVNFGAHGGCKNGEFWGHVNYVDHENQFHMKSVEITGYLFDPAAPDARDICGWARINDQEQRVMFRVRLVDNGEPGSKDTFGITIDNWYTSGDRFYHVSSRKLANGEGGGGNVQLHKGNNSNTASPAMLAMQEWQMCGDLSSP